MSIEQDLRTNIMNQVEQANKGYKNYTFTQNNSGGLFVGPVYFTVTATSYTQAFSILTQQHWYTDSHCECCGPRWGLFVEESEL